MSWETVYVEPEDIASEVPTPKGRGLILYLFDGRRILLTKRSRRQYLSKRGQPLYFRVKEGSEPGLYYTAWVATELYTPIPHTTLRDAILGAFEEWGINVEWRWKDYFKRTGIVFVIDKLDVHYARVGDAVEYGVLVTNANTAEDSIRVFGYANILRCSNRLINSRLSRRIAIVHKGEVERVLAKVVEAVRRILSEVDDWAESVVRRLETLQTHPISEEEIKAWMKVLKPKLPKKHLAKLARNLRANRREFGDTRLAVVQALTRTAEEARSNIEVQRLLFREAERLLEGWEG